ncbi:hypothetical protein OCU04_012516 [Sclerotinia nivalis]|uniref:Uncharacterized protein n=1 Tax=Sclerotinia nivalis TaxID=352851 RepID=A0A9X0A8R9_9HELO|nr:hypothetical protein OCU04_012516 [Sclerotinia nivalis]
MDGAHAIDDGDLDSFLAFLGIKYLPYLIRERDSDPLSLHAVQCRQMLNDHHGTKFDLESKEFLKQNCKFLLELCEKPVDPNPAPAPLTSLKLQLVIVDRSLEARSKAPTTRAPTLTNAPAPANGPEAR